MKQQTSSGKNNSEALSQGLPLYSHKVQNIIQLYPVEEDTKQVLDTLNNKGIITLALTTRSLPLIERTTAQLHQAGLELTHSPIFDRKLNHEI